MSKNEARPDFKAAKTAKNTHRIVEKPYWFTWIIQYVLPTRLPAYKLHLLSIHMHKRAVGTRWEEVALQAYIDEGRRLVVRNFTMRGGEIDLIVENSSQLVFVEVKVVDSLNDLYDYITPVKLKHLTKTIERYLYTHPTDKQIQIDVVFVQQEKIIHQYRNITLPS